MGGEPGRSGLHTFSRAAAGRLLKDYARPQIVFVVGDGKGPLMWYEWVKGTRMPHEVLHVDSGHSLQLLDFDGDGKGGFAPMVIARGIGLHESKMADLDGNGTLDVLAKPYDFDTPRLDVWLNLGPAK